MCQKKLLIDWIHGFPFLSYMSMGLRLAALRRAARAPLKITEYKTSFSKQKYESMNVKWVYWTQIWHIINIATIWQPYIDACAGNNKLWGERWVLFPFWHHHLWPKLAPLILKLCRRKRSFQWYPDSVPSDWVNKLSLKYDQKCLEIWEKNLWQNFPQLHFATLW